MRGECAQLFPSCELKVLKQIDGMKDWISPHSIPPRMPEELEGLEEEPERLKQNE